MKTSNGRAAVAPSAAQYLEAGLKLAESFAAAAQAYLDAIGSRPRVRPRVGGMYQTYDLSVAQVVQALRAPVACNCLDEAILAALDGRDTSPADAHSEPIAYRCCVVRGGHGNGRFPGHEAGERFFVHPDGLTIIADQSIGDVECLIPGYLHVVGLSLESEVEPTYRKLEVAVACQE